MSCLKILHKTFQSELPLGVRILLVHISYKRIFKSIFSDATFEWSSLFMLKLGDINCQRPQNQVIRNSTRILSLCLKWGKYQSKFDIYYKMAGALPLLVVHQRRSQWVGIGQRSLCPMPLLRSVDLYWTERQKNTDSYTTARIQHVPCIMTFWVLQ